MILPLIREGEEIAPKVNVVAPSPNDDENLKREARNLPIHRLESTNEERCYRGVHNDAL